MSAITNTIPHGRSPAKNLRVATAIGRRRHRIDAGIRALAVAARSVDFWYSARSW